MNYDNNKAIFIQIADIIYDRLLSGNYYPLERSPSIRELAVEMQVTPNTVVRSYEKLLSDKIIYNKRGIGYFFEADAKEKVIAIRSNQFTQKILPSIFKEMSLLGMSIDDLLKVYNRYNQQE